MNVLIATQEKYVPFIMETIQPYDNSEHIILMNFRKPTSDFNDYDIGISFMWDRKIQDFELDIAPWINFHPGPLPEYKGRNLCYHAIMNGETEFGATVHYMDENFDTGDIIQVRKFPVLEWWTAEDLSTYTLMQSRIQFERFLPRILAGEDFLRYPNSKGMYYKKANIAEVVSLDKDVPLSRFIRAVYYPPYYPKFEIGGVTYKIVKDE
jgi:methionyl-tRNA formyltransferase